MKKLILPVVLVASSLVFFSFKPMSKTVNVKDKAVQLTFRQGTTCNERSESFPDNFVRCQKISSPTVPAEPGNILNKY